MAIITIFGGIYCHSEEIATQIAEDQKLKLIDNTLMDEASIRYNIHRDKLSKAVHGTKSILNRISREREKSIAYVRKTLADLMIDDNLILTGFTSHLLPNTIPHILRVCIIANHDYRKAVGMKVDKISDKEATKRIHQEDKRAFEWTEFVRNKTPWDEELYDVVLPMHDVSIDEAVNLIIENLQKDAVKTTKGALKSVQDNILSSEINLELTLKGHDLDVSVEDGKATLLINKSTLRLESYITEIENIVSSISGVKSARAKVGPLYNTPSISPMGDFTMPSKVLLVDDEKDFVHTLSERLETRDFETAVVYNGEEAISYMNNDEAEVIVLDLKMPGIDGLEVLKQVKKSHPHVEVIILTGHGSEQEREIAMELGAFAYLQKPANIDQLSEKMKQAYKKVQNTKNESTELDVQ